MASLLSQIVHREPLGATAGNSGNPIERVRLVDGRELILKRVSADWDWMSRATDDGGRIVAMWDQGVFARMPASIEHTIVDVHRESAGWSVLMRDVSSKLLSEEVRHDRAVVRRLLTGVAELHNTFWGEDIPGLCSIEQRYGLLSMATAEREKGRREGDLIVRSWESFHDNAPADIAEVIATLADRPTLIGDELRKCSQTLVHGDLRLGNAGLDGDRLVLLDWGERTGIAPPAVELAWFIGFDAHRLAISPDDVIVEFRAAYGDRFEQRALDLGLIGGLLHLAAHQGLMLLTDDERRRAEARDHLSWWVTTVRRALETWSPSKL
ncbi:MAG TPA: phosphotransferase [Acidimicrobiales bacterium]|nr:phosphotransferase [Acidimicrobiales bacterium]